jgi:hypothetical protein
MKDRIPEDDGLDRVVSRLEAARPSLADDDLARVKRRAVAATVRLERKERIMRKRFALTAVLAVGLLMSSAGATLAIDGISSRQDASVAQYGVTTQSVQPTTVTTPEERGVAAEGQGVEPTLGAAPEEAAGVQPARQVAESGNLPFTGYAGFTILLIGLVLLGTGFVLRRGTRSELSDL